jgi:hypothetical protein
MKDIKWSCITGDKGYCFNIKETQRGLLGYEGDHCGYLQESAEHIQYCGIRLAGHKEG